MAQREEAGKEDLKVPEQLKLCALSAPSCSGHEMPRSDFGPTRTPERPEEAVGPSPGAATSAAETAATAAAAAPPSAASAGRMVNRCAGCRRKVGLTGFRCRCGDLFCGDHRYSDRHGCSYDYKAAGREAIRSENPVVKAAKIVRI